MCEKLTHEQFVSDLKESSPNIEVLSTYINARTEVKLKCKKCGRIWQVKASTARSGRGCVKCYGLKQRKTHEEFMQEVNMRNTHVEVLGKYVTKRTKIKCRCKKCGYTWDAIPQSILYNNGCLKCLNVLKKTHSQYIEELKKVNPNIKIISEYKGTDHLIKCECLKDGHIWEAPARELLNGRGCAICKASRGERKIEQYLKSNLYKYEREYKIAECKFKLPLPFDFAVFRRDKLLALIEYQGEQHYNPMRHFGAKDIDKKFKYVQMRDNIKKQYCIDNGVKLIEIPYWERQNVELILDKELTAELAASCCGI